MKKVSEKYPVICWFSGGVTSTVACKLALEKYGKDNCRVIFMDTVNEDEDTYRFLADCQDWYGVGIETITAVNGREISSIQGVWIKNKSLNVANGAVCSARLKRDLREKWQRRNKFSYQVFGFDIDEPGRAKAMKLNNAHLNPVFPLIENGLSKQDCVDLLGNAGIKIPVTYSYGFRNNNCFKTGCVQGGIGYWQKMKRDFPEKFDRMAEMEHKLTDLKGEPVTMLVDRAGGVKRPLFLKPHLNYPDLADFADKKGREPEPLKECNGFCGINDLEERSETEDEINFDVKYVQLELF